MSITSRHIPETNEVEIKIRGRFDFSTHQDFRKAFQGVDAQKAKFVLDFKDAEYLDSSALGMLLLLRERAGGDRADIRLRGCSPQIRQILSVSNFEKLFAIQ